MAFDADSVKQKIMERAKFWKLAVQKQAAEKIKETEKNNSI